MLESMAWDIAALGGATSERYLEQDPRPLDDRGGVLRVAPVAMAGALALALLPFDAKSERPGFAVLAALLLAAILAALLWVPWPRLHRRWQVLPPLAFFLFTALLRHAEGGASSSYGVLSLLPVLWLALYGTRVELLMGLAAMTSMFSLPVAFDQVHYPTTELRRAILWLLVASVAGGAVQILLEKVRAVGRRAWEKEAALNELQSAYEAAVKTSPVGMARMDLDGRYLEVNDELCTMLGRPRAELLGLTFRDVTHPEDLEANEAKVDGVLAGEAPSFQFEKRYVRPNGSDVWAILNVTLVSTHDGRPHYLLLQAQDITAHKRAEEEILAGTAALASVAQAARAIMSEADPREAICAAAAEVSGATFAALSEPRGREVLALSAHVGVEIPPFEIRIGHEPSGAGVAFASGERFFVPDAPGHPAVSQRLIELTGVQSMLFEPIANSDGTVVGVLIVGWEQRMERMDERAVGAIGLLALDAAVAIERSEMFAQLEHLARTDALTGLPNRRVFDEDLAREMGRANRSNEPLSLAILDIDHFKRFNDEHGHQAGDVLLKELASAWRSTLRPTDVLARYGGEEFFLLMPNTPIEGAHQAVERLRALSVSAQTFSAGIASWDGSESDGSLVARADHALYDAKEAGRNRTIDAA